MKKDVNILEDKLNNLENNISIKEIKFCKTF